MKIIGITGGIGSGKSRVLSYMSGFDKVVICQTDHVAWELQMPGQTGYQGIVDHFGDSILSDDGRINRQRLGEIVFHDDKELQVLNQIMHPAVKEAILNRMQAEKTKDTKCFVIEAALLLEDGYKTICDELWYIYADQQVRSQRLTESREYSKEKIDAIMKSQLPDELFRKQCEIVIDNSGDFKDTCYQIDIEMKRIGLGI